MGRHALRPNAFLHPAISRGSVHFRAERRSSRGRSTDPSNSGRHIAADPAYASRWKGAPVSTGIDRASPSAIQLRSLRAAYPKQKQRLIIAREAVCEGGVERRGGVSLVARSRVPEVPHGPRSAQLDVPCRWGVGHARPVHPHPRGHPGDSTTPCAKCGSGSSGELGLIEVDQPPEVRGARTHQRNRYL